MKKPLIAAMLWAYAGWTAGSAAVFFFGGPEIVGPLAGLASLCAFIAFAASREWNLSAPSDLKRIAKAHQGMTSQNPA
jgi:hypothetical protein